MPLRYRLTKGAKTASELTWDFDATTDGKPGAMPTLIVELETLVEDVAADGTARLRVAVTRTRVRDRAGATGGELMRTEAAAMQGVTFTEVLAPDGALSGVHVDAPAALPEGARGRLDGLSRSLEQMAMRLPSEPVGVGAIWRERRPLPEGGIRAVAATTYTLTSRTGDTIAYTAAGSSNGAPQTIDQEGLKVQVTSAHGDTATQGSVDLVRYALATMSRSTFTTAMTIDGPKDAPGTGASTVTIAIAIQVAPIDAAHRAEAADADAADANDANAATTGTEPASRGATEPAGDAGGSNAAPAIHDDPDHGAHKAP
jgi:hypothetical protein